MNLDYNMRYLQDYLNALFKYVLKEKGSETLKSLLTDLINNNESKLLNKKVQEELNKYSPKTIKLIIEKNVLLSLEHSVFSINKSYWAALKDRYPNISTNFIILYFDKYINYLKNPTDYHTKYIDDLISTFDNEIKESMKLKTSFQDIINKTSNINLEHMKNFNANGRTISVGENRKGGIFLTRDSNIGYGKFVNKQEFLNNIKSISKSHKVISKKGRISNEELENIVNQIGQAINITDNEKNKNSRIITDVQAGRKAGNIFTGNNGFDLPNGEYVSVEEMTLAINKYIRERNKKEKDLKIVRRKGMFKKAMAASLLAMSLLTTKVSAFNKEDIKVSVSEYENEDVEQKSSSIVGSAINSTIQNQVNLTSLEEIDSVENNMEKDIVQDENKTTILEDNIQEKLTNISEETKQEEVVVENEQTKLEEIVEENSINENMESTELIEEKVAEEIQAVEEPNIEEKILEENNVQNDNLIDTTTDELNISNNEENIEVVSDVANNSISNEVEEATSEDVVEYALQFVGNPYVYGGNSLTKGVDCSGFTKKIYSNFGIELPRYSNHQRNVGNNIGVDLDNALPGDLLCFNGHVGIYIGDGKMVHAANPRKGIIINDVNYDKNKKLKAIIRFDQINQIEEQTKTK